MRVGIAGSLMNLAKMPSSTVQILGAEKALFRALKAKEATPKYGLIYHATLVGQAKANHKGKVPPRPRGSTLCPPSFYVVRKCRGRIIGPSWRFVWRAGVTGLECCSSCQGAVGAHSPDFPFPVSPLLQ